jgi:triosephosphate isomerase
MSLLLVANFKSNLSLEQVKAWIAQVKPADNMVIAPSFPHLALMHSCIPAFTLAAQDVSPFPPGSYTGAVNPAQLKELGVAYCIVGHSERRRYFHETANDVAGKIRELISCDITPILCMEEADLAPQFAALESDYYDKCIYCFEPGSGLGGTVTATLEDIENIKNKIYQFVPGARFMYGGSVTTSNVEALLPLKLDGLLVATASLDPDSFISISQKVSHVG